MAYQVNATVLYKGATGETQKLKITFSRDDILLILRSSSEVILRNDLAKAIAWELPAAVVSANRITNKYQAKWFGGGNDVELVPSYAE